MDLGFEVSAIVARPPHDAFEAVADPQLLSRYFTTGGASARLATGATVMWDFHDFPGAFPVEVLEVVTDERIILRWQANEGPPDQGEASAAAGYQTQVTFRFEPVEEGRTRVVVAESGWRDSPEGLRASYGNCMGWSQMLCALKVWLEHGINLRDGMYR
jgi:uncharacterized protein YndB with AHSA1/START domain